MALAIGFANQFYTLWDVSTEDTYATSENGTHYVSGFKTNFTFYQNLSTDLDKAQDKASLKGCKNLNPDSELRGKSNSWFQFEKSDEQKRLEEEARLAKQKKEEDAYNAQLKYWEDRELQKKEFENTFRNGREFRTASNFRLYDEGTSVRIAIIWDAENEYEEQVQKDNPWGYNLEVPVKLEELARKEYNGSAYYTLKGIRSMKGLNGKIQNGNLLLTK
jgi:hypothetical protein